MFDWVLQNTIVCTALLCAVAVGARFLHARPAVLHILWLLVIVRLILPPLPMPVPADPATGSGLSYWAAEREIPEGAAQLSKLSESAEPEQQAWPEGEPTPRNGGSTFFFASGAANPGMGPVRLLEAWHSERFAVWRKLAFCGWLLGALLVLVRELRGTCRMQRLVREARPPGSEIVAHVGTVAREMGVRMPRIRAIPGLRAPFVWSLTRPILLLDATREAPPRSVLAHELAHVKRRDHWAAWLEVVALCLHWWNPVLHVARARMRRAMELACDAWVVHRYPGERLIYARALVDAAASEQGVILPRALGALGPTGRAYEERLVQILHSDAEARVPRFAAIVIALLALPLGVDWAGAIAAPDPARVDPGIARMLAGIGVESWRELEVRSRAELDGYVPGQGSDEVARARGESFKNLGLALLARSAWAEGVSTFRAQIECGFQPESGRYNLACAHARNGDPDAAFALLQGLSKRGAVNLSGVRQDPDLASLAADPRWSALVASGSDPPPPGADPRL